MLSGSTAKRHRARVLQSELTAAIHVHSDASTHTIQATLCVFTARTVSAAIQQHAGSAKKLIVCGGGVHNNNLMCRLAANLPELSVDKTDAYGIMPDWVEAAAFAWLAKLHTEGKPGKIPAVTGATRAVPLGRLFRH